MFGEAKNYYEILGLMPEATYKDICWVISGWPDNTTPDHNNNGDDGYMVELNDAY